MNFIMLIIGAGLEIYTFTPAAASIGLFKWITGLLGLLFLASSFFMEN